MKTKKIVAVVAIFVMLLSLMGCGESEAFKKNSDALVDAAKKHGAEELTNGKTITDYPNGVYDTSNKKENIEIVKNVFSSVSYIDVDDIKNATVFVEYYNDTNHIQSIICDFSSADISEDFFNASIANTENSIYGIDEFVSVQEDNAYYVGFNYAGREVYYIIAYDGTALTYMEMIGTNQSFTSEIKNFISDFTDATGYKDPTELV